MTWTEQDDGSIRVCGSTGRELRIVPPDTDGEVWFGMAAGLEVGAYIGEEDRRRLMAWLAEHTVFTNDPLQAQQFTKILASWKGEPR